MTEDELRQNIAQTHVEFGLYPEGCAFCGAPWDDDTRLGLVLLGRFTPDGQQRVAQFLLTTCPDHHDHPWITRASYSDTSPEHFQHAMDPEWLAKEGQIVEELAYFDGELERLGLDDHSELDQAQVTDAFRSAHASTLDIFGYLIACTVTARAQRQADGLASPERDELIAGFDRTIAVFRHAIKLYSEWEASQS